MKSYDITFQSANSRSYSKPITAFVVEPDQVSANTGVLLCTHGWGGNRFDYRETMEFACEPLDVVCVSTEFRQSGFDFDPRTGRGSLVPYDASFYQVIDVLNALRTVLELRPGINRSRLFHYGGSQGGFISLLSTIYAPNTFAYIYAAASIAQFDDLHCEWAGRTFTDYELSARDVIAHAEMIKCPLTLSHGTADETVPHEPNTVALAARLRELGKDVTVRYYEGGDHAFAPVTTRFESFKELAVESIKRYTLNGEDDFARKSLIKIPCANRTLVIDWSKSAGDYTLIRWE